MVHYISETLPAFLPALTDGTLTIGVNGLDWFRGLSAADTNKALDMAEAAGVTSVRLDISWYVVESTKGTYDWSYTDPLVDAVLAHRMTVIGQVFDTPAWLSGSTNYHTPPTTDAQVAAFAKFAADAATHYNGKITTWEIWNEPNLEQFWTNPDPVAYAKLLKAVYPAIKAVNPNATVVTGGLAPMPGTGIDGTVAWVEALYAAGAGGYFDALGVHPYYWPAVPNMNAIAAMHDVMVANGDGDKQIWLTEAGAPTGTAARAVSEAVQAQTIAKVVQFAREHDYIGAVYIYSLLASRGGRWRWVFFSHSLDTGCPSISMLRTTSSTTASRRSLVFSSAGSALHRDTLSRSDSVLIRSSSRWRSWRPSRKRLPTGGKSSSR